MAEGLRSHFYRICNKGVSYKGESRETSPRALMTVSILLYASAQNETVTLKDWNWGTDATNFYYASTMNDAGHLLCQYCYFKSGSCIYFLGISIACEVGSLYYALLISDAESSRISLAYSHKHQN